MEFGFVDMPSCRHSFDCLLGYIMVGSLLSFIQAPVLLPDSSLLTTSFKMTSSALLSNHQDALLIATDSEEEELPAGDGDEPQDLAVALNDYYRAIAEVMMLLDPAHFYACGYHGCAAIFLDTTSLVLHKSTH